MINKEHFTADWERSFGPFFKAWRTSQGVTNVHFSSMSSITVRTYCGLPNGSHELQIAFIAKRSQKQQRSSLNPTEINGSWVFGCHGWFGSVGLTTISSIYWSSDFLEVSIFLEEIGLHRQTVAVVGQSSDKATIFTLMELLTSYRPWKTEDSGSGKFESVKNLSVLAILA